MICHYNHQSKIKIDENCKFEHYGELLIRNKDIFLRFSNFYYQKFQSNLQNQYNKNCRKTKYSSFLDYQNQNIDDEHQS